MLSGIFFNIFKPCLSSLILVCIRQSECKQILQFEILVCKNEYEYSFGICPRSKTRVKIWYSSVLSKAMRSVKRYASYAKNPEFRVIPLPLNSVFNENNSVTLTLT